MKGGDGRVAGASAAPLAGVRIVVLRAAQQAVSLISELTGRGAIVVHVPLVSVDSDSDRLELTKALARRPAPDWLVFTSANGVNATAEALLATRPPAPVAVVGSATRRAAAEHGWETMFVPTKSTAASLAVELPARGSCRVLAPLAELASDDLEHLLSARGFDVRRVQAYRLRAEHPAPGAAENVSNADLVVFTSPSLVDRFFEEGLHLSPSASAVSIGPRTTGRLMDLDVAREGVIEASPHDGDGIIAAIEAFNRR